MPTSKGYLKVQEVETYYEIAGEGIPLLLLHGGLGGIADFGSQFHELSRYFKVIAFERTGHGRTADTNGPFTYQSMADQTISFMEALGLDRSHMAGWSDGATVALLVALRRPDLTRSLVYISQNYNQNGIPSGARKWMEAMTAESFRKEEPTLAKRYEDLSPDGPSHFPAIVEKTRKLWLTEPNMTREDLSKVSVPSLVIAADRDIIPVEHMTEIVRSIGESQLCVIPGATHFLLSEKPGLVNKVILDFLQAKS